MLYELLVPLADVFSPLNVFRYLTFRASYAMITALLISMDQQTGRPMDLSRIFFKQVVRLHDLRCFAGIPFPPRVWYIGRIIL